MFCPNCGNLYDASVDTCPYCGFVFRQTAVPPTQMDYGDTEDTILMGTEAADIPNSYSMQTNPPAEWQGRPQVPSQEYPAAQQGYDAHQNYGQQNGLAPQPENWNSQQDRFGQNPPDDTDAGSSFTHRGETDYKQLKTNRSLLKLIFLGILTLGIYDLVVLTSISMDINTIAGHHDGKKTMNYLLIIFLLSWLTLGIAVLVWYHRLSARIGEELNRRNIDYNMEAGSFWGWGVLGTFIIVGPFIYTHKLCKSMNLLCEDYNHRG